VAGRTAGIWLIIMMAKGASSNSILQVGVSAPEVPMAKAPIADLPVALPSPAVAIRRGEPDLMDHKDSAFIAPFRGSSSAPIGDMAPTDTEDDLKPARGLVNGVLISVPLWVVIIALTWLFLAW
jgi:hypothetical protein